MGTLDKVLVVHKDSTYSFYKDSPQEAVRRFATSDHWQAKLYRESHAEHNKSLHSALRTLDERSISYDVIARATGFDETQYSLIIAMGGDGTLLEASHRMRTTPLLGLNTNPGPSVGHYCACTAADFGALLDRIEDAPRRQVARIHTVITPFEHAPYPLRDLAINDIIFMHTNGGATAKYVLNGDVHKDYGVILCTPSGSGAFMKAQGGVLEPLWEDRLQYKKHAHAVPTQFNETLTIESLTREGNLFIDGEHLSYPLGLGDVAQFTLGDPLTLIARP